MWGARQSCAYPSISFLQGNIFSFGVPENDDIDNITSYFLNFLFRVKGVHDFDLIRSSIIQNHNEGEREFISRKFEAIKMIYSGFNMIKAYQILKELYEDKEILKTVPEWIAKDLLIDLRNLKIYTGENPVFKNEWQLALDNYSSPLFYPTLDRQAKDIYQNIVTEEFETYIKDFGTSRFASWQNSVGEPLARYLSLALYNCSFAHIEQFKKLLFRSLWPEFQKNEEAIGYLVVIYKILILSNDVSDFDKIQKKYRYHMSNLEQQQIVEIFEFSLVGIANEPSKSWFLRVFSNLGIFLSKENFKAYLIQFKTIIRSSENNNLCTNLQILSVFLENTSRIEFSVIYEFFINYFEKYNNWQINERMLQCILKYKIEDLEIEEQNKIINLVTRLIPHFKNNLNNNLVLQIVLALETGGIEDSKDLSLVIENLDDTNKKIYENQKLQKSPEGRTKLIDDNILESIRRNNSYGTNNTWTGYSTLPFDIINNILLRYDKFDDFIIHKIIETSKNILTNPKQLYSEKISVVDTLLTIYKKYPLYRKDLNTEDFSSDGVEMFISHVQRIEYEISIALLKSCYSRNSNFLRDYFAENKLDEIDSKIAIARRFVNAFFLLSIENIDQTLISLVIDFFTFSFQFDNKHLPVHATRFFISLLQNEKYQKIAVNMLMKICHSGNSLVRIRILRVFNKIKEIDGSSAASIYEYVKTDQYFEIHEILENLSK